MTEKLLPNDLRLCRGDCLDPGLGIADRSVDMVLCDLPYGTTANKWDSVIPFEGLWQFYDRVCKPGAAIVLTASQPFTSALVMSNPKNFRHEWVWIKNRGSNFANTVREPMKEHESILVFSKGKWTYNRQMQDRTGSGLSRTLYDCDFKSSSENYREFNPRTGNKLSEKRVPSSWQKFNTVCGSEKTRHPTQKPVSLMEYFIKTYSNPGDVVLDNCMGSGTTGVACANLKRGFIGIEKDAEYFSLAYGRMLGTPT